VRLDAKANLAAGGRMVLNAVAGAFTSAAMGCAHDIKADATLVVASQSGGKEGARLDLITKGAVKVHKTEPATKITSMTAAVALPSGGFAVAASVPGPAAGQHLASIRLYDGALKPTAAYDMKTEAALFGIDARAGRIAAVGFGKLKAGYDGYGAFIDTAAGKNPVEKVYAAAGKDRLFGVAITPQGAVLMAGATTSYGLSKDPAKPGAEGAWHLLATADGDADCGGK